MENKHQLEAFNKATLDQLEQYMKAHSPADGVHHDQIHHAKDKWQAAWNEFLETLVVLERLEI